MGERRPRILRCSPILASMLAVLSISLFSWGLGYKLSLYHSDQCHPKMTAAKLLSQKERPLTAQSFRRIRPNGSETAVNLTPYPSFRCSHSIPVPRGEHSSPHLLAGQQHFTIHTSRKPPPNVIA